MNIKQIRSQVTISRERHRRGSGNLQNYIMLILISYKHLAIPNATKRSQTGKQDN